MAAPSKLLGSLGFYSFISFLAFFPCLVLDYAYFDNDLMSAYGPFRAFLKNQLSQGHFPLWNPYIIGGQPFFADPNAMMCYPLTYLTLPFSIPVGLSLFFFLHMAWAGLGMHLWLEKIGRGGIACRVGALSFALSGFFWWELIHPNILAVFSWMPWFLLCLEKWLESFQPKWAFLTGLCFASIFCCGHFQMATYVFYAGTAYFLFRYFIYRGGMEGPERNRGWGRTLFLFLFAAWGSLPLLVHFIPTLEYFRASNRGQGSLTYDHLNAAASMKPLSILQFFFPSLNVPQDTALEIAIQSFDDKMDQENNFFGALGYIGIWAPFLMGLAYFHSREKKWFYFLGSLSLSGLLSACGRYLPLHRLECLFMPGIALSRAPYRFLAIYVISACALGALGFDTLEKRLNGEKQDRFIVPAAGIYSLVLLMVAMRNPRQAWAEILPLVLGMGGLLLWAQNHQWKKMGRVSFLASVLVSLFAAGWSSYSLGPASNFDLEKNFPAFSLLRQNNVLGRYYFDPSLSYPARSLTSSFRCFFPEDAVMALGTRSSGGYDGIYLQKAADLREVPIKTFFKLMAVKGLLFGHEVAAPEGYLHIPFSNCDLYESKTPPPYLFVPSQIRFVQNQEEDLAGLKQPDFDPFQSTLLTGPIPDGFIPSPPGSPATLRFSILRDDPDDQSYKIQLNRKNLMVFSEIFFPGWKAWIDGQPAALLTADHALRSLWMPAGEHVVEFRYQPVWFKPIIAGARLWLLSLLVYGFFWARQKTPKGGSL